MAKPTQWTMLDLVQAVAESAQNDDEIVATVVYLVNSRKVRLCGNFAGVTFILPPAVPTVFNSLRDHPTACPPPSCQIANQKGGEKDVTRKPSPGNPYGIPAKRTPAAA